MSQGYDYAAAAAYSDLIGGEAFVVSVDGSIAYEHYSNGFTATQGHVLNSATKSITGLLCAFAVQDNLLGFDERVSDTLTEWQPYPKRASITYRQLLGLVSGIDGGPTGPGNTPTYAASIVQPMIADPGTTFSYGPVPFQIFGEALERKLKPSNRTVEDYLRAKILTPLGIQPTQWIGQKAGEPNLPNGASILATELVRIGEFVRNGGVWQNQRLLAQNILDELFKPVIASKPGYGIAWYLTTPNEIAPADEVHAFGADGQYLFVSRSEHLVMVRYGLNPAFDTDKFYNALMPAATALIGPGCMGTNGVPDLSAITRPVLGSNFTWRIGNLPLSTAGVTYVGFSKDSFSSLPLPIDLTALGMTGCHLRVSLDVILPWAGSTTAQQTLPLPAQNALFGLKLHLQSVVIDLPANAFGLTMSNAGTARLGAR